MYFSPSPNLFWWLIKIDLDLVKWCRISDWMVMTYFYLQENFAARRKTKSTAATIVCVVWSFWILICANLSILNKQVIRRNKNSTLKSHSPFLKFEGSATLVMIHKPKWKARAREYKSFFPVQILQHPVSVIIFSNIYKKINARIIGLTNQI